MKIIIIILIINFIVCAIGKLFYSLPRAHELSALSVSLLVFVFERNALSSELLF